MGSTFNPQILVEKLTKLNSSQQSIETLSHWCIFHMNKAKLVVETWEKQFHSSPRDRRLSFLYLANDIIQNSRKKGGEFVAEFWRVLPEALRDVIRNGDDSDKNAAHRLIGIWDDRKVFGSCGHILKEEFVSKQSENSNTNGRQPNLKLKQAVGNVLDKIVSDFEMLYDGEVGEDALLNRCTSTISTLEKIVKDFGSGVNSGKLGGSGSGSTEEMQGQHASLKECIEQLTALESSRASLVSHLRDALQEEETKLDQLRSQLQAAQLQSDLATNVFQQFNSHNIVPVEQGSSIQPGFKPEETEASPVVYTRQASISEITSPNFESESRKSAAAAVAAKLTASTSSAEMLSLALTSLVSGVAFGNTNISNSSGPQESSGDHQPEKRPKLENESCLQPSSPPPLPSFLPPDSLQQDVTISDHNNNNVPTSEQVTPGEQPLPPLSSPPMPPQFVQTVGSMSNVAYSYGATTQPSQSLYTPGYPSVGSPVTGMSPYGPPGNPFQPYQVSEDGFFSPPSTMPMASMPHQQSS